MKKQSTPNLMLTELVIVLFFFSLSAAVILQLFVASHNASVKSEMLNAATLRAEDISNRFSAAEDAEAFFASIGFENEGEDQLVKRDLIGTRNVIFSLTGGRQDADSGAFYHYQLTAIHDQDELLSIPIARYIPKEEQP